MLKKNLLPGVVWGLGALFYFYEFLLQVSPSVMVPELMRDFSVTAEALGILGGVYFCAYASMQIPAGVLLDRFGPRRLLTYASATCVIGTLLFALTTNFMFASLARLLIGLGSAFAAIGCFKLATNWFPPKRFSLLTGILLTIGMLGAIGGETPLALMVHHIGWRSSLFILVGVGTLLSLTIWLVVRDQPHPQPTILLIQENWLKLYLGLKHIVKNKQTWLAAIYGGLMFAPTSTLGGLWGVPFLMATYDLSRPVASSMISLLFVGWAVGSPITGWVSDTTRLRRPPMFVGASGALLCMLSLLYINQLPLMVVSLLLFSFGFFSSGFLPMFSIVKEINPRHVSASATGFANMLNMLGGAFMQPLIGCVLDYYWKGELQAGTRIYSVTSYHIALGILPILITIALLILPFVKETYSRELE